MSLNLKSLCWFGAMIALAGAGIFQVVDQTSMIVLTAVLLITGRNSFGSCRMPWRKGRA